MVLIVLVASLKKLFFNEGKDGGGPNGRSNL